MRRVLATGTLIALIATSFVAGAAGASDIRRLPQDQPRRGLIYQGLTRNPQGPCGSLFQAGASSGGVLCTHGPDAAPKSIDVTTREPMLSGGHSFAGPAKPLSCVDDGVSGARVQAIYAVPEGTPDRYAEVVASIRRWAEAVEGVVSDSAAETNGVRGVRWVTQPTGSGCELDVDHVVLSATGADSFLDTVEELEAQGYIRPDRRYLAWVDADLMCGIGGMFSDDEAVIDNANNGMLPLYSRVDTGCWGLLDQPTGGSDYVSVEAHELMHNFGAVQPSAPHATGDGPGSGGHCFDEWDVMCYDDDSDPLTFPLQTVCPESHSHLLDCNHDDYFHTDPPAGSYLDTHWNPADAIFFSGSPFPATRQLTVTRSGPGSGVVRGELFGLEAALDACRSRGGTCDWGDEVGDVGIECGASCTTELATNMWVTLRAEPAPGSSFGGWSGGCEGARLVNGVSMCNVRLTQAATLDARFSTPAPRPDLLIKKGSVSVGNDIYNSTGANQSQSASVARGSSVTFEVTLQNDSSTTDSFKLKGTGNSTGFVVQYFIGTSNITSYVNAGTITFQDYRGGASARIRVVIKAKSTAAQGAKKVVKIVGTSLKNTQKLDAVKATVTVS